MRAGGRFRDRSGNVRTDDRAVSEVVGFVISFSMIVLLVGVAYVGGFTALDDLAEGEQMNNAGRAMRALAESVDDVQRGDSPGRAGELRLQGGELAIDESVRLNVTVVTGTGSETTVVDVGALRYRKDDRTVWTETGAVFRNRRGGSAMVREPAFVCADDRAVISLVTVTPARNRTSVAGDGSVLVIARLDSRRLRYPTAENASTDAARVNVTVNTSANVGGWQRYFDRHEGWDGSGREFGCDASRVYVRETVLRVRFVR